MSAPSATPPFPLIASHRGGARLWAENSRIAFERTAELPVDLVEFDVQRTRDGVLVVFHDARLDRVTDATGLLAERGWDELRQATLLGTGGDRILTLDEVIEIFRPTGIDLRLEIKPGPDLLPYPGIEAEIASALSAAGMLARTQITSFRLASIETFAAAAAPGRGLLWLIGRPVDRLIGDDGRLWALARDAGADQVGFEIGALTAERIASARAAGLTPGSFATHTEPEIRKAQALGVAVFTTDRPDLALRLRDGG